MSAMLYEHIDAIRNQFPVLAAAAVINRQP